MKKSRTALVAAASVLAVGSSLLGVALSSGSAMASNAAPTSVVASDSGANVQDQSTQGLDTTSGLSEPGSSDAASSLSVPETSTEVTTTEADGVGGSQDTAPNAGTQATGAQ